MRLKAELGFLSAVAVLVAGALFGAAPAGAEDEPSGTLTVGTAHLVSRGVYLDVPLTYACIATQTPDAFVYLDGSVVQVTRGQTPVIISAWVLSYDLTFICDGVTRTLMMRINGGEHPWEVGSAQVTVTLRYGYPDWWGIDLASVDRKMRITAR